MNEAHRQLLTAARTYATEIFRNRVRPEFVFHSLEHTEDVVEACSHMADHYQLNEDDRLVLLLAAWFHDVGYAAGSAEDHEEESVKLATEFFAAHPADDTVQQRVAACIRATKMPQSPVNLVEKILCDADLYHLSTEDFRARNSLLKQEREAVLGQRIDKKDWRKSNIQFLTKHHYFTDYGQQVLTPKKLENLAALQNKGRDRREVEREQERQERKEIFPYKPAVTANEGKDAKNNERGVQTMFRTTSNNHIELSSMADNKAHILITVNSIILSVMVSYFIGVISFYPWYYYSTGILLLTCLITITLSILATRPSINSGRFTEEDIRNKKTNLLFFGNFHRMGLSDYQWGVNEMIRDKEYLYNTMTMDIYYLGVVLARKYRLLRIAYTVFMIGIIVSVLAFAIATFARPTQSTQPTTEVIDFKVQ